MLRYYSLLGYSIASLLLFPFHGWCRRVCSFVRTGAQLQVLSWKQASVPIFPSTFFLGPVIFYPMSQMDNDSRKFLRNSFTCLNVPKIIVVYVGISGISYVLLKRCRWFLGKVLKENRGRMDGASTQKILVLPPSIKICNCRIEEGTNEIWQKLP